MSNNVLIKLIRFARDLQGNGAIGFLFGLDLVLHACADIFDVIVLGVKF